MKFLSLSIVILLLSCTNPQNNPKQEIIQIMNNQQEAWNLGSLEDFMLPYWKNDSLAFIGSTGINFGWKTTLENYKKSYPNKSKMGILEFNNKTFKPLGKEFYHVNGQWTLFRNTDTLSGHYSLVWQLVNNKWVIINDHSS